MGGNMITGLLFMGNFLLDFANSGYLSKYSKYSGVNRGIWSQINEINHIFMIAKNEVILKSEVQIRCQNAAFDIVDCDNIPSQNPCL